jgi:hypothetical protein
MVLRSTLRSYFRLSVVLFPVDANGRCQDAYSYAFDLQTINSVIVACDAKAIAFGGMPAVIILDVRHQPETC